MLPEKAFIELTHETWKKYIFWCLIAGFANPIFRCYYTIWNLFKIDSSMEYIV